MARPKRVHPMLRVAQEYIRQHMPELQDVPLRLRSLDGPPGSPRYAVTAEECVADTCPYAVTPETAAAGKCPVIDCQLRHALRLLINRDGTVVEDMRNGIHWAR